MSGNLEETNRRECDGSLQSLRTFRRFMTFRSYNGEITFRKDMIFGIGTFAGSRRNFKSLQSLQRSRSNHFDRQSNGGERRRRCLDVQRNERGRGLSCL